MDDDIPSLPHEVWWIIFSFLKLETRVIASTVCSGWRYVSPPFTTHRNPDCGVVRSVACGEALWCVVYSL